MKLVTVHSSPLMSTANADLTKASDIFFRPCTFPEQNTSFFLEMFLPSTYRFALNHNFWGVKLSLSGSVKCLEVILDSRWTWRGHVDVKMRKAHNLLWACRRACGARWGLKPKVVHWLYVAIVRPTISFASLVSRIKVCWRGCQTASAKKRLSKEQRI